MNREEIKNRLKTEMNYDMNKIIDYICYLEINLKRCQKGMDDLRMMLSNRVTRDRYNSLVKKYNKLAKEKNIKC